MKNLFPFYLKKKFISNQMFHFQILNCAKFSKMQNSKFPRSVIITRATIGTSKLVFANKNNNKVSISPTFYEHLFYTKEFCTVFMWLF